MKIVCDAGGCCGIKTIRDVQYSFPAGMGRFEEASEGHDNDEITTDTRDLFCEPWQRITEEQCQQSMTNHDMLLFLIAQIKERRPAGMILVNLSEGGFFSSWAEILGGLGFERTKLFNSNSCNAVVQFRLVYNMGVCEDCGSVECCCDDEDGHY